VNVGPDDDKGTYDEPQNEEEDGSFALLCRDKIIKNREHAQNGVTGRKQFEAEPGEQERVQFHFRL
jgi:hypothetical protein